VAGAASTSDAKRPINAEIKRAVRNIRGGRVGIMDNCSRPLGQP
jgi:hypothetical protein